MIFDGCLGPGFGRGSLGTSFLSAPPATFDQQVSGSRTSVLSHLCSAGATCWVDGRVSFHPGSTLVISSWSSQHVSCTVSICFSFSHLRVFLSFSNDCKWSSRYSKMSMLLPVMVCVFCQRAVHALSEVLTSCTYSSFTF